MKLALIGATGFVGSHVLDEALSRGHEVTALARHVENVRQHDRVRAQRVDVSFPDDVAAAVSGHDAVISCFHGGGHDVDANPTVYRDIVEGTRTMIEGVKRSDVRRIVYVGGCGSLYVRPGVMLVDDRELILSQARDSRPEGTYPEPPKAPPANPGGPPPLDIPLGARMALYLFERERELDWTFISPSRFLGKFGGRSGRIVYGDEELLMDGDTPAKLDVEDLAIAVMEEVESGEHIRGHFTVATRRSSATA